MWLYGIDVFNQWDVLGIASRERGSKRIIRLAGNLKNHLSHILVQGPESKKSSRGDRSGKGWYIGVNLVQGGRLPERWRLPGEEGKDNIWEKRCAGG